MNPKKYERRIARKEQRRAEADDKRREKSVKKPGKYANKSLPMRVFHKYTGFIVISCLIVGGYIAFTMYDEEKVFFENFSCYDMVLYSEMSLDNLTEDELVRWNELLVECEVFLSNP